jgi:hypothetical protein
MVAFRRIAFISFRPRARLDDGGWRYEPGARPHRVPTRQADLLPRNWTARIEKILAMSQAGDAGTIDEDEQI